MLSKYRHEKKLHISQMDYHILKSRLSTIMQMDSHVGSDGMYRIHSLYFDNIYDMALREKVNGINKREKFRIRYYNNDLSYMRLEKKSKINGLCKKESTIIKVEECRAIINGDLEWMKSTKDTDRKLIFELYVKMHSELLRPRTVITYNRIPFVFEPGNVRVTLDSNIRTSAYNVQNFLDIDKYSVPVIGDSVILEVKYDEFLPDIIKKAVSLNGRSVTSYSKYERGRCWG